MTTVSIGTAERFDKARFASERAFVEHVLGLLALEWRARGAKGMRIVDADWEAGDQPLFSITTASAQKPIGAPDVRAFLDEKRRRNETRKPVEMPGASLRDQEEARLAARGGAR